MSREPKKRKKPKPLCDVSLGNPDNDCFGETHPERMPKRLFSRAKEIHYETAVRADTDKQYYSVSPRCWYVDAIYICADCQKEFKWTAKEQRFWFETLKFWYEAKPQRCITCRANRRHLAQLRKEYDQTVAEVKIMGTPAQKRRVIKILASLQENLGTLPKSMSETKRSLERQLKELPSSPSRRNQRTPLSLSE
jgi:hypothetical protein